MKKMPPTVQPWYERWIKVFPESWSPLDMERFYMFVSVLLERTRIRRSREWLESNLREDCKKLSETDIKKYGEIYENIRDFTDVWKSQQAKNIAKTEWDKKIEAPKRQK